MIRTIPCRLANLSDAIQFVVSECINSVNGMSGQCVAPRHSFLLGTRHGQSGEVPELGDAHRRITSLEDSQDVTT